MRPGQGPPWELVSWLRPRRRRPNPLLVLARWRYELVLGAGVPTGLYALAEATQPSIAVGLVLATLAAHLGWPAGRRFLAGRARCVLVPHRLRVGMVESRVLSWSGWLPAVLWTSPCPQGVRVLLWCPAGVDVHAFHAARSQLAAACWAADVEAVRHPRFAQLVVLLVVTEPRRQ